MRWVLRTNWSSGPAKPPEKCSHAGCGHLKTYHANKANSCLILFGHNAYHHPNGFTFCRRCSRVVAFDAAPAPQANVSERSLVDVLDKISKKGEAE